MHNLNKAVIVSARLGSTRLPGKALKSLQGIEMIRFLFQRLKTSKFLDTFIFATTLSAEDKILTEIAIDEGFKVFSEVPGRVSLPNGSVQQRCLCNGFLGLSHLFQNALPTAVGLGAMLGQVFFPVCKGASLASENGQLWVHIFPANLEGLKENVIVGRLVPAGTGLTKMGWDKEAQKEDKLRLEELKKEEQESAAAAE